MNVHREHPGDRARTEHQPADLGRVAGEVRRLRAQGLTPRDIASALRIGEAAVRALLDEGRP